MLEGVGGETMSKLSYSLLAKAEYPKTRLFNVPNHNARSLDLNVTSKST